MKSYFSNTHQSVRVGGQLFSPVILTSDVPQRSIVALLLFAVRIDDHPEFCENYFPLHAQMTLISLQSTSPVLVEIDLSSLKK